MSMQFPVKTVLGRFQTRSNRIVVITSSEPFTELIQGEKVTRRIWNGEIMKADGKTVDTAGKWEDNGAFCNQRGVACPMDLNILVSADPVSETADPVGAACPACGRSC